MKDGEISMEFIQFAKDDFGAFIRLAKRSAFDIGLDPEKENSPEDMERIAFAAQSRYFEICKSVSGLSFTDRDRRKR